MPEFLRSATSWDRVGSGPAFSPPNRDSGPASLCADRRIRRSLDADGAAGTSQESVSFAAYAGDVRTLEIAKTATVSAGGRVIGFLGQVVQRNFYGNGEDEILAVDKLTWTGAMAAPTSTTSTFWTFTDHQNSVRDIVSGTSPTLGQVVDSGAASRALAGGVFCGRPGRLSSISSIREDFFT